MGKVSLLFLLLVATGVAIQPAPAAGPRPKDFGTRWVRSHPFTIMGLTQRPEAVADDKYARAGFGTMLAWKRWPGLLESAVHQGIPWHIYLREDTPLSDRLKSRVKHVYETYPGGQGFLVWDEPERPELKQVARIVAWLKATYPDALVYSKAYIMVWGGNGSFLDRDSAAKEYGCKWLASGTYDEPPVPYSYDDYLRDFVLTIRPDVLCIDPYPFIRPPEGDSDRNLATRFFKNMAPSGRDVTRARASSERIA